MTDYTDCTFQPVKGDLIAGFGISLETLLQTGNRTTHSFGVTAIAQSVRMYARWRDGENGSPVVTFGSANLNFSPHADSVGSVRIRQTLPINDVKILNTVDYVEIRYQGVTDTYTFNKYYYLVQTTPFLYGSRAEELILTNSTFTPQLTLEEDGGFTGEINSSYDKTAYDIYISKITNVALLRNIVLPYELPLRIEVFSFDGTVEIPESVRFELQAGRISTRDSSIILEPTIVSELAPPTIPENPTESIFSPIILSVEKDEDNKLVCNYLINPSPVAQTFTSMTLKQRRISNPITQFEPTVTQNYQTRSLTGQVVEDGETVRIQLVMLDHNNVVSESVVQDYTQVDGELTLNTDFYEQQSVKSTKIHVTKVRHDTIDLLLINDRFNDEFVTSVTARVLNSNPPISETIPNNLMSSNIELTLTGLPVDTPQTIIISAIAKGISFEIQRVGIKTTISIPDNPSDDLKKMQSMQRIINMAFDNDILDDIEGLGVDELGNITRDVLMNLQEPSNLGVVYDRNRSNRKGSVYNKGESDTVRHNYPKTLAQILATNPIDIPTVSEGYN